MIKFGTITKEELLQGKTFFGRKMKVSIPLVLELFHNESSEIEDYSYFNEIKLGGTFKKTVDNRFAAFDEFLINILHEKFDRSNELSVHDMAVSSGVTSVEFYDKLHNSGFPTKFTASDKFTHVFVLNNKKYNYRVVLGPDLEFLQFIFFRFVIDEDESGKDVINYFLMKYVIKHLVPLAKKNILECGINFDDFLLKTFSTDEFEIARIPLLSKKVINKCTEKSDFRFFRHDIFKETSESFDVVRAMNILNLAYFDRNQISIIRNNIFNKLNENGLFIVGRTPDDGDNETRASVFVKKDQGLHLLADYHGGSEVREIILNS